jgi:hypothetical protein
VQQRRRKSEWITLLSGREHDHDERFWCKGLIIDRAVASKSGVNDKPLKTRLFTKGQGDLASDEGLAESEAEVVH